MIQSYGTSPAI